MKSEKIYIEYLVLKLKAGDDQVLENLIKVLSPKIRAFVIKHIGNCASVDDCVQDSLMKTLQNISQVKSIKAVHTWLYRIVHSVSMDYLRKLKQSNSFESFNQHQYEVIDETVNNNQRIDVNVALARLSEAHQTIIYLFYYESFNVSEISEILSKPQGTIKYELFQARDQIKKYLS